MVGMIAHIVAGTIALVAGGAALLYAKGGPRHALAGWIFLPAMLVMAVSGGLIAIARPAQPTLALIAAFSCYLLVTSWTAARRRARTSLLAEWVTLPFGWGCAAAFLYCGVQAAQDLTGQFDGYPAAMFFTFSGIAGLAAMLDVNFILRSRSGNVRRITRHLWRMCAALFIASASFFLGQQDEFPKALQGSPVLLALAVAPLVAMVYWMARVRLGKMLWGREQVFLAKPESGTAAQRT